MGIVKMKFALIAVSFSASLYDAILCPEGNSWGMEMCEEGQCAGETSCNKESCCNGSGELEFSGGLNCNVRVTACQMDARALLKEEDDFDSLDDLELETN